MSRMAARATLVLALGLMAGAGVPALAQDPTVGVDVDVPYVDPTGAQGGLVTVRKIEDPFTKFRKDSPPGDGQRYVQLTVAFEAADDKPFETHPSYIVLKDTNGFLWGDTSINRPPDAKPRELEGQQLEAGDRVSGAIDYVVPKSAVIDEVLFRPSSGGRLIKLVDQVPDRGPAVDTDVPYVDPTGALGGLVTVRKIEDPFTAFREDSPPGDGQRYVQLTVAFEAADDKPFEAHSSYIILQDTDGFMWGYTSINRPPDATPKELESQQLEAGDRVSGAIDYVVPTSAVIDVVFYQPSSGGRLIRVAGLSDTGTPPVTADCEGVEAWLTATIARLDRATEMSLADAAFKDPQELEPHRAEYADLAVAQGAGPVPAVAQPVNDLIVGALEGYAAALKMIIELDPQGEDPTLALTEAVNTFNDAGASIQDARGQIATLASTCGVVV